MIPYGIVYSDNVLSLNESRKQWLKKEKIINKGTFILGYLFIVLILAMMNIIVFPYLNDKVISDTLIVFLIESVLSLVLLFLTVKKNKENAYNQSCYNANEKKQIVLRENSAVFTAPYRQSEYFYDEIESVVETQSTITIFFDSKYAFPVYISKNSIEKGDILLFKKILAEKTGNRYEKAGGNF